MKKIKFSLHSLIQMKERGSSRQEVEEAIQKGEKVSAKKDRHAYRLNFQYNKFWADREYAIKQVMPIVVEEGSAITVITVYTFYF